MNESLSSVGRICGYIGIMLCVLAVAGRFYGSPFFLGREAGDFFIFGIASMVLGCWLKLEACSPCCQSPSNAKNQSQESGE